ncbi:MAG: hypothetical protein ACK5MU_00870 [Candidatus Saccharimonadales bacterium]
MANDYVKADFKKIMHQIVERVQVEAAKIPDFDAGTIRLTFNPLCEEAGKWLGDWDFGGSKCEPEFVFPIHDGGSHTRKAGWRGENCGIVNTYGYSALKVAAASYARAHEQGNCSEDAKLEPWPDDWCDEEHGYAPSTGCVCYEIDHAVWHTATPDGYDLKPFMRIHVSVSGATGEEDKRCAMAAFPAINGWCRSETRQLFRTYSRQVLYLKGAEK